MVKPEESLQIVDHIASFASQVAALALHQEEYAARRVVHLLVPGRIVEVAQVLNVEHTFIAVGDDTSVKVVHDAADGVGDMTFPAVRIT